MPPIQLIILGCLPSSIVEWKLFLSFLLFYRNIHGACFSVLISCIYTGSGRKTLHISTEENQTKIISNSNIFLLKLKSLPFDSFMF